MGITKYKKSLKLSDRFNRLGESIKSGKKKEEEMKDTRRRQNQDNTDKASNEISSMATTLMIGEGLSYIEALLKATEIYKIKSNNK